MKKLIGISVLSALLLIGTSSFAQGKKAARGLHEKAKIEEMATALELSAEQREQVETIFKTEKAEMKGGRVAQAVAVPDLALQVLGLAEQRAAAVVRQHQAGAGLGEAGQVIEVAVEAVDVAGVAVAQVLG